MSGPPELEIALTTGRDHLPGDEIAGTVAWKVSREVEAMQLRLFWYTKGAGIEDLMIVDTVDFPAPRAEEHRPFRLRLPDEPFSFTGRLFSLIWALELVALPRDRDAARVEITVSPDRRLIDLTALGAGS